MLYPQAYFDLRPATRCGIISSGLQDLLFTKKHKEDLQRWEGIRLYKRVVDYFVFECFHSAVDLQFHGH